MPDIKTKPRPFADLRPKWIMTPEGLREGVEFDCPCGTPAQHKCDADCRPDCPYAKWPGCEYGRIHVYFSNTGVHKKASGPNAMPLWTGVGETWAEFTMAPSLHCVGHWHGHIKGGMVISC